MDSDVEIIGEAFVSSQTMGVEWQQIVDDVVMQPMKKVKSVISKKQTRKISKVHESNKKSLMKVCRVLWVARPHDTNNSKTTLSTAMSNKIFKWSQGLFCKCFWTSQHICQFEILSNFLYDIVKEDNIDYPLPLTWINDVIHVEDDDFYAVLLLFVLTCLKHVCNATLWSLEKFMNSPNFNVNYVLQLGENDLKLVIQHLGTGNKNTSDIILMFEQIKNIWKNEDTFLVLYWNW